MAEKDEKIVSLKRISNERASDKPLGFIAALLVHAALFFALLTVFQWKTEPQTFYAELWAPEDASGDVLNAKRLPQADPEPVKEEKLPDEVKPEPVKEPEADIKQLDEEKKKAEEEAKKRAEEERAKELERQRIARIKAERAREMRRREEMRKEELARILGAPKVKEGQMAGSVKGDPMAVQQNLAGSLSAAYTARVVACIRPHIVYSVPANIKRGEHQAVYKIQLLPDGSHSGLPVKSKSSGLPAYDDAVARAIRRCDPVPKPKNGQPIPRTMQITFDPIDDKQ